VLDQAERRERAEEQDQQRRRHRHDHAVDQKARQACLFPDRAEVVESERVRHDAEPAPALARRLERGHDHHHDRDEEEHGKDDQNEV
jgi:hypothetical protein